MLFVHVLVSGAPRGDLAAPRGGLAATLQPMELERRSTPRWDETFPINRRSGDYIAFEEFGPADFVRTAAAGPGFAFDLEIFHRHGNFAKRGGQAHVTKFRLAAPVAADFLPNMEAYACAQ